MKKMKKAFLFLILVLGLTLYFSRASFAADKIGSVNLDRIFGEYNRTKEQDKILEKKQKDFEVERDVKVKEIKSLQDKLNLADEKQKAAKKTELEIKIKSFQENEAQKVEALKEDILKERKEILKDIEKAVKQCAEAGGYTLVFEDRALVFQSNVGDLTDKAIETVNKNYQSAK